MNCVGLFEQITQWTVFQVLYCKMSICETCPVVFKVSQMMISKLGGYTFFLTRNANLVHSKHILVCKNIVKIEINYIYPNTVMGKKLFEGCSIKILYQQYLYLNSKRKIVCLICLKNHILLSNQFFFEILFTLFICCRHLPTSFMDNRYSSPPTLRQSTYSVRHCSEQVPSEISFKPHNSAKNVKIIVSLESLYLQGS